ncbi:MAG: spermidine/putrescine ABC transporter substrate-binding protein [Gemmatimonadales bacterium]|nr:spermidine/putrescine ABC transporter substrate-binding protein [Gemmatimonadales bacterium]
MDRNSKDVPRRAVIAAGASALAAALGAACAPRRGPGRGPLRAGLEPELRIYNWSDYVAPDTVARFEAATGVRVIYDTYESNEEVLAKLQAGAAGYDVIVPSGYLLPVLVAEGLVQPLDHARLPGLGAIAEPFRRTPFDPGLLHGVPYQWGMTGLAYRADKVPAPTSWAVYADRALDGTTTMLDDGREVLGAMLKWRGRSYNSTDPAELASARDDAIAAKRQVRAYLSAAVKGQLISGDVWVAQLWNGDARQAAMEEPAVRFAVPSEGSLVWTDFLAIPRTAPHPRAAHAFLEFVLGADVGAAIADHTGYGSPNLAALRRQRRPVPLPGPAELARLEYQHDLGAASALWDRLWTEVKAA